MRRQSCVEFFFHQSKDTFIQTQHRTANKFAICAKLRDASSGITARSGNRSESTPLKPSPVAATIWFCFVYDAVKRTKAPAIRTRVREETLSRLPLSYRTSTKVCLIGRPARPFVARGTDALTEKDSRGSNDVLLASREEKKGKGRRRWR